MQSILGPHGGVSLLLKTFGLCCDFSITNIVLYCTTVHQTSHQLDNQAINHTLFHYISPINQH